MSARKPQVEREAFEAVKKGCIDWSAAPETIVRQIRQVTPDQCGVEIVAKINAAGRELPAKGNHYQDGEEAHGGLVMRSGRSLPRHAGTRSDILSGDALAQQPVPAAPINAAPDGNAAPSGAESTERPAVAPIAPAAPELAEGSAWRGTEPSGALSGATTALRNLYHMVKAVSREFDKPVTNENVMTWLALNQAMANAEELLYGSATAPASAEREQETVRSAARNRKPLSGPDAQAIEGALQQVERELRAAQAELAKERERAEKAEAEREVMPEEPKHELDCLHRYDVEQCNCGALASHRDALRTSLAAALRERDEAIRLLRSAKHACSYASVEEAQKGMWALPHDVLIPISRFLALAAKGKDGRNE